MAEMSGSETEEEIPIRPMEYTFLKSDGTQGTIPRQAFEDLVAQWTGGADAIEELPQPVQRREDARRERAQADDLSRCFQQLVDLQREAAQRDELRYRREVRIRDEERAIAESEKAYLRKKEEEKAEQAKRDVRSYNRKALPTYQQSQDILNFLVNFRVACLDLQAPEELWPKLLRTQCSGVLADILAEFPDATWTELLDRIKSRCGHTTEGLRVAFRSLAWDQKESVAAYGAKLLRAVDQWTESANAISGSELRALIAREKLLEDLPRNIQINLLDRKLGTYADLVTEADIVG